MKEKLDINGMHVEWMASQDSEHPDLEIFYEDKEFYLQVELNAKDFIHNRRFMKGWERYPITELKVIKAFGLLKSHGLLDTGQGEETMITLEDNDNLLIQ